MKDVQSVSTAEQNVAQMQLRELSLAYERFLMSPRAAERSIKMRCEIITALWKGDPRLRPELKLLTADVQAMRDGLKQTSFTTTEAKHLWERYLKAFDELLSILQA